MEFTLSKVQYVALGVAIGCAVGLVVGLVPLILGIRRKKTGLGVQALIATIVAGGIANLILALPTAAVFVWLIVRKNDAAVDAPKEG